MSMFNLPRLFACTLFWCALAGSLSAADPAAEFPLRDGDIWVMAGDSITAQHLHSNYFEAFCFARYPELKFAFRNSGVGGHTIPTTLARFEYDIAAWQPTVVSVELGMNDKGGTTTEKYLQNMKTMVERIRAAKARPIILAASPVNNGETQARLAGGNQRLHEYAAELHDFCKAEKIPYADQFHRLLDVWGNNKPRELLANSTATLKQLASDNSLAGVEHLREFLAAQAKEANPPVSMQGDPVHPGPPGQLMMAAALLKELGARSLVSSATIDAAGKLIDAKDCTITEIVAGDGKLAFTRLDERLPFPIPDETRGVVGLDPTILELSEYMLQISGLKPASYLLKVNGAAVATLSEKQLAAGVNLTHLPATASETAANPISLQGRAILSAVAAKEQLVSQWRGLSQRAHTAGAAADLKASLAALTAKVEEADAKIRAAAQPQKLQFEIAVVK